MKTASEYFHDSEAAYKKGRSLLANRQLAEARVQAIKTGELALKAKRAGLPAEKFALCLRARDALADAVHRAYQKQSPLRGTVRQLASKFIAEEMHTRKYPRKQAIAIGISRAKRATEGSATRNTKTTIRLRHLLSKY